ncbi:MAG: ATP-binding cassette domain-containing protein, partial [Dehalococcoidia bacterium]
ATHLFEIDEHTHQIKKYPGNYDAYRLAKDAERKKWEDDYLRQQEEISELRKTVKTSGRAVGHNRTPRDRDKFIRHFKAERVQEAVSRNVRAAEERLRRIMQEPISKPPKPLKVTAGFTPQSIRSSIAVKATGITKRYGPRYILRNLSLTLGRDSRVAIVGPNGSGKTTLLRILAGHEAPDDGRITFAPRARVGFLPQEPQFNNLCLTVVEAYREGLVGYERDFVFNLLQYGLFRQEDIDKTLDQLSVGQLRKLELARLIAQQPNLLILDEPTNYLSLDVLEAFEATTAEFLGPVIAASHDHWFIDHFKGEVMEISEGSLVYT